MGVGQGGHGLVPVGKVRQQGHHVQQLAPHHLQALPHDDHVGIVAHIAAGGAQMDDARRLGALQAVGVHMAHHVVAAFLFPADSVVIVDVLGMGLQLGDLLVGDVNALLLLGLGQGNPQPAPGAELVVLGENELHLPAGIPGGEGADVAVVGHGSNLPLLLFKGDAPCGISDTRCRLFAAACRRLLYPGVIPL